jgi:hypothetical protein
MGGFRSFVILAAGIAIGGALVIAHRVSEETGKGISESFADVPAEVSRIISDVRARTGQAAAVARDAYEQKQAEMEAYLHGGGAAE